MLRLDLKAGKSYVWSLCTLILLAICASFVLPMFLSPRRVSNSLFLIDSLRSFDLDNLLVLGGGRYLSNFAAYKSSLAAGFDFSGFMLNLPSIDTFDSAFYSWWDYSGLGMSFLSSRTPNSILAWLCHNLRFFHCPMSV